MDISKIAEGVKAALLPELNQIMQRLDRVDVRLEKVEGKLEDVDIRLNQRIDKLYDVMINISFFERVGKREHIMEKIG